MKKLILTALSLSMLASAAFAAGPNSGREEGYPPRVLGEQASEVSQSKVQTMTSKATREELDDYAGRAIKANPENYRTKK